MVNHDEFMNTSKEMLLTDLKAEQIDQMTLSADDIKALKGSVQEIYLDRLGYLKQLDMVKKINEKTIPKANYEALRDENKSISVHEMIQMHQSYFDQTISKHDNFLSILKQQDSLTLVEKNMLINLHNTASGDEIYGERLFYYLIILEK